jgi:hypothetical protein
MANSSIEFLKGARKMGLDVYLRKCANKEAVDAILEQFEKERDQIWDAVGKPYQEMTEAEKDSCRAACDELAEKLGLNEHHCHPDVAEIEFPSAQHPDHLFQVGYFRSSYNSAGIDSLFHRLGFPDLYDVFNPGDDYEFTPNWDSSLKNVSSLIGDFSRMLENGGIYDAFDADSEGYAEKITSEKEAIARFKKHFENRMGSGFRDYSSGEGVFHLDGIDGIVAFIPGVNCIGRRVVYVVYKRDAGDLAWYLQALEIVKETIEYVLRQPDKDDYYLVWSS